VKVVSNSTPIIALAKINRLNLLRDLFGRIAITPEVYAEVVVFGAGLPGAVATSEARWIDICPAKSTGRLHSSQKRLGLDIGEVSTLILAAEIRAELVLLDDLAARKLAQRQGFRVQGTVGILEACYARKLLEDLREAYRRLLSEGIYLDRGFLNSRLELLRLDRL
jgi:predicted nucleic acid-binding protein